MRRIPKVTVRGATAAEASRHRAGRRLLLSMAVMPGLVTAMVTLSPSTPSASAVTLTANWIEQAPATSPPPRTAASMAYDPATGTEVLFGGYQVTGGPGIVMSDTWTWDGTTWTEQFPGSSPPGLYGASMTYDAATATMVLFGGISSTGQSSATWTWDGTTWTAQSPKTSPSARDEAAMAYDPDTSTVVLFGGSANRAILGDTWTWDGTTWTQVSPSAKPPARYAASMAFDPSSDDMVLFGGYNGSAAGLADTWGWSGDTWREESLSGPSGRYAASMAYDSTTDQIVLFGGDDGQNDLSDMWAWGGNSWTELFPNATPTARRFTSMDFDAATGSLVLFGGDPGGVSTPSTLGDTWTWGFTGTFTVSPAMPTVILGGPGTDNEEAAVTGNASAGVPTGTVSFYVCGPTATPTPCTSQADQVGGPVALVSGSGDTATAQSSPLVLTSPGYWCADSVYSGDANYSTSADASTDGCVLVDPAITTTPAQPGISLGGSDSAGATVYGNATNGAPTGTVSFYLCGPTATPTPCTSTADPLGTPEGLTAAAGDTATAGSASFVPNATGYWCTAAAYAGDTNYQPGADTTTDGCVLVSPVFSTAVTSATVILGGSDTDVARAVGNATDGVPTGTVTFYECGLTTTATPCTSRTNPLGTAVALHGTVGDTAAATSPSVTPNALGFWCFAGVYSGDAHYGTGTDDGTDECVHVVPSPPVFTSAASLQVTAKQPFTFTVTTTAAPAAHVTGVLPKWLKLTDNGNGTATLQATAAKKGKHTYTLRATNTAASVTQAFVLTVKKA